MKQHFIFILIRFSFAAVLVVSISNNLFAQKTFQINLVHQSQNVSGFSTEENLREIFRKNENEIYYRYIFDHKSFYQERLKIGKLNKDSAKMLIDKYAIDTPVLETSNRNCIYILIKRNEQTQYNMYVDLDFNRDFSNDSATLVFPGQTYSFKTQLEFYEMDKIQNMPILFRIKPNFSPDPLLINYFSLTGLSLSHNNCSVGTFLIDSKRFYIEFRYSQVFKKFALKNVTVNLSEPGKSLQKIDFVKILGYNTKTDTIITGDYHFIIDSINLNGTKAFIRYFIREKKVKNWGYKVGNYLEEFFLKDVYDTTKIDTLSTVYKTSEYTLFDFWGSWCIPCINNFGTLKMLFKNYPNTYFSLIGFDSEFNQDTQKPIRLLKNHSIEWKNFFVNMSYQLSVNNKLIIKKYPTYILVNREGKIIFRESVEGFKKITKFLNNNYHLK